MKASELIFRLQAMMHHQGDLEVVVLDKDGEPIHLKTLVAHMTPKDLGLFVSAEEDVLALEHKDYRR